MVWYSHLLQNFPQFIVIHTVKGFGIVKKEKWMFFEIRSVRASPPGRLRMQDLSDYPYKPVVYGEKDEND